MDKKAYYDNNDNQDNLDNYLSFQQAYYICKYISIYHDP
jgi:hypothetical protein